MKKLTFTLLMASFAAIGQTTKSPIVEYGESISLENARKILNAARTFAVNNQWTVVIAIVDTGGNLVLLEKLDHTQVGSIDVAIGKAKTANNFKRPSKAFEDVVAGGGSGLRVLTLPGAVTIEGGEPIYINGKIVGAIGVSGMASTQDGEVVKAGLAALK